MRIELNPARLESLSQINAYKTARAALDGVQELARDMVSLDGGADDHNDQAHKVALVGVKMNPVLDGVKHLRSKASDSQTSMPETDAYLEVDDQGMLVTLEVQQKLVSSNGRVSTDRVLCQHEGSSMVCSIWEDGSKTKITMNTDGTLFFDM